MRRHLVVTVLIFATFTIEGCRRMRDTQRPAVPVRTEDDFLINRSKGLSEKLKPKSALEFIVTVEGPDKKGKYTFPESAFDPRLELNWSEIDKLDKDKATAIRSQFEAEVEARKENRVKTQLMDTAELFKEFCDEKEITQRSFLNFHQFVRRKDRIDLRDLVFAKTIVAIMEADVTKPKHVVLYHTESLKGGVACMVVTPKKSLEPRLDAQANIDAAIQDQRLAMMYSGYKSYLNENQNPATRDYDSLKSQLKTSVGPDLYEAHLKGEIKVFDPAKLNSKKGPLPLLVVFSEQSKQKGQEGHRGVSLKGAIGIEPLPLRDGYLPP